MDFVFYRKKLNILRQLQCNDCLRIKGDVMKVENKGNAINGLSRC